LLWFLHALLLMFAIYPLARLFLNNLTILLLFFAINGVLGSDYLVFGEALANMPFFAVGVMLRENRALAGMALSVHWPYVFVPLTVFLLTYLVQLSVQIEPFYGFSIRFLLGVAGSLFVINLSHFIAALSDARIKGVFMQVGYYSMGIYLLHTLFESTVRIGFLQVFKGLQTPFGLVAFIAITCGIIIPLALEKEVLRKYWFTRKFVLGLS
jgi:hypothetical protein